MLCCKGSCSMCVPLSLFITYTTSPLVDAVIIITITN